MPQEGLFVKEEETNFGVREAGELALRRHGVHRTIGLEREG
jgi:hypothetical protein